MKQWKEIVGLIFFVLLILLILIIELAPTAAFLKYLFS
jgi:hypothetical protein